MAIHKRKNRDGTTSHQVRVYVAGRGKVYVGSYPSARAAKDAQYQAQEAFRRLAVGGPMTFAEFVPMYLARIHVEESTRSLYAMTLNRLGPHLGSMPLHSIDKAVIEDVAVTLGAGYSPSTVRHTVATLSALLNAAYDWHHIPYRPDLRRLRLPKAHAKMRVLDADEIAAMLAHDEGMLVLLGLATGARIGELVGLDWPHITTAGRVRIVQQYQSGTLKPLKNDEHRRTLVLPDEVREMVNANRTDGAVFRSAWGTRMTTGTARATFVRIATAAGVSGVTPHVMRHTVATELLARGIDIVTVAAVLGDKRETVLRVYAHVTKGSSQAAADALSGVVGTTSGTT